MTLKTKLELERSQLRKRAAELAGLESPTEEQQAELEGLPKQSADLESRYQAAILAEPAPEGAKPQLQQTAGPRPAQPPEVREAAELQGRVESRSYLSALCNDRALEGAEAEYSAALGLQGNTLPWAMLLPPEARADASSAAPATVGAMQASILNRVFANGAAAYLGASMVNVGPGDQVYHQITSTNSAAFQAVGSGSDIPALTVGDTTAAPKRVQLQARFRKETLARVADYEAAVSADLRGAVLEKLDQVVIAGGGTNEPSGLVAASTAPSDPTAVTNWAGLLDQTGKMVDGRYAVDAQAVKWLWGTGTFALAASALPSTGGVGATALQALRDLAGGVRVSAHIPATGSNKIDTCIAYRSSGTAQRGPALIVPAWLGGLEVIRDNVTRAKEGETILTAAMLVDVVVRRPDQDYKLVKNKHTA